MKATLRHIYLCRTANMSWRTCVIIKQIQSNQQMFVCWKLGISPRKGVNTLRPTQNGPHIFKCIFLNENVSITIKISLKFFSHVQINHLPALAQIMAWRRSGDKPLSEQMMVRLPPHICVTRPKWFKWQATTEGAMSWPVTNVDGSISHFDAALKMQSIVILVQRQRRYIDVRCFKRENV